MVILATSLLVHRIFWRQFKCRRCGGTFCSDHVDFSDAHGLALPKLGLGQHRHPCCSSCVETELQSVRQALKDACLKNLSRNEKKPEQLCHLLRVLAGVFQLNSWEWFDILSQSATTAWPSQALVFSYACLGKTLSPSLSGVEQISKTILKKLCSAGLPLTQDDGDMKRAQEELVKLASAHVPLQQRLRLAAERVALSATSSDITHAFGFLWSIKLDRASLLHELSDLENKLPITVSTQKAQAVMHFLKLLAYTQAGECSQR